MVNLQTPVKYEVGGMTYIVHDDSCKILTLTCFGAANKTPGKPLLATSDGTAYQVPVGKKFTFWGAVVWSGQGNDGHTITIAQSDASDAATNAVVIWKGYLGNAAESKYDWYPLLGPAIKAEKYIIQFGTASNGTEGQFGYFIGCEEDA